VCRHCGDITIGLGCETRGGRGTVQRGGVKQLRGQVVDEEKILPATRKVRGEFLAHKILSADDKRHISGGVLNKDYARQSQFLGPDKPETEMGNLGRGGGPGHYRRKQESPGKGGTSKDRGLATC